MKEEFNTVSNTDDVVTGSAAITSSEIIDPSSLAVNLDPSGGGGGAMTNGNSGAPGSEQKFYSGQSDKTTAAVRGLPSYPMSPNNNAQTKILPRATPEQSLRPTLLPDGSFSHVLPPQVSIFFLGSSFFRSHAFHGVRCKIYHCWLI